ncbi:MAG: asparagine synthase (glutamine-hydrolyzing) [Acidimicrobiia bacterium]
MCGIAGIVSFTNEPINDDLLQNMGNRLIHRGPDAGDTWTNANRNVGFSHRRLSIIDVAGSPQPMVSNSKNSIICFNGEIFNYKELRTTWNYEYKTNGDTETLLAGYENDKDFINKLRGQFAFAIFDEKNQTLNLYRDRLGILPLYYYHDSSKFIFASEIKAILPALKFVPEIDKASISDYLAQRGVPAPNTLYEGIKKLEPGSMLTVTLDKKISLSKYYEIPNPEIKNNDLNFSEAVNQLDEILYDSVSAALVADVPVGAYLSGGIDSSLICAMISKHRKDSGGVLETFSAKFIGGNSLDETPFARSVSNVLGTTHHEVVVTPNDFIEIWPKLSYQFDAPVPEPPDVAFSQLAKLARENVTVVLSGEGSDELFGGYPKYQYAKLINKLFTLPGIIRTPIAGTLEKILPASMNRQRTLIRALAQKNELESFRTWFAPFTARERKEIFDVKGHDILEKIHSQAKGDVLSRMSYVDMHAWLADNILERGDRTSMMHSLELRPPFLDKSVLEFSRTLPSAFLANTKSGKLIVREVAKRYLDEKIFERPKHGFKVPLDDWFRGQMKDFACDHIFDNNSLSKHLFDQKFIKALIEDHVNGKFNDGMRIYTLLSLELWYKYRASF